MSLEQAKLVISLISLVFNAGLFALFLKVYIEWNTVKERLDILWYQYCEDHHLPYRAIGKNFERRKS